MTITFEDVRRNAARCEQRDRRQTQQTWFGLVIIVGFFASIAWRNPGWRTAPSVLLMAGAVGAVVQSQRLASSRRQLSELVTIASLEFYCRALEKERDNVRNYTLWFAPGFLASIVMSALEQGITILLIAVTTVLVFTLVAARIQSTKAATTLDRRIRELRAMADSPKS